MTRTGRFLAWLVATIAISMSLAAMCAAQTPLKADRIVVVKSKRQLSLMRGGQVIKTYAISLGRQPEGAKVARGDKRTPEGHYTIDNRNPRSAYHLALHVSYPNSNDRLRARQLGVSPGANIMIHGLPNGGRTWYKKWWPDWTAGCIAVSNAAIEEIYRAVPTGTPIDIYP